MKYSRRDHLTTSFAREQTVMFAETVAVALVSDIWKCISTPHRTVRRGNKVICDFVGSRVEVGMWDTNSDPGTLWRRGEARWVVVGARVFADNRLPVKLAHKELNTHKDSPWGWRVPIVRNWSEVQASWSESAIKRLRRGVAETSQLIRNALGEDGIKALCNQKKGGRLIDLTRLSFEEAENLFGTERAEEVARALRSHGLYYDMEYSTLTEERVSKQKQRGTKRHQYPDLVWQRQKEAPQMNHESVKILEKFAWHFNETRL